MHLIINDASCFESNLKLDDLLNSLHFLLNLRLMNDLLIAYVYSMVIQVQKQMILLPKFNCFQIWIQNQFYINLSTYINCGLLNTCLNQSHPVSYHEQSTQEKTSQCGQQMRQSSFKYPSSNPEYQLQPELSLITSLHPYNLFLFSLETHVQLSFFLKEFF